MSGIYRVGSAFSTLPFDGIDNVANDFFHEDFVGAGDAASGIVQTAKGVFLTTTTAVTAADGEADHPGIVILEASFLTPGEAAHPSVVPGSEPIYLAAVLQVPDISADAPVVFGLNDTTTDVLGDVNDTFVGITLTSAGAFELEHTDAGEVDFDVTVVDDEWVILELSIDDDGVYGRVTTDDTVETRFNAASSAVAASYPILDATGTVNVDAWHQRFRRSPVVNNTDTTWLGA